jgi:phosphocarrier protein FPr
MNFLKKLLNTEQSPITSTLIITSSNGLHLRPIAKFVNEVKKFNATVTIIAKEQEVSALQVPKILSLALEEGDTFILKSIGEDARKSNEYLNRYFQELMREDSKVEIAKQEDENYQADSIQGETIARGVGIAPLVKYRSIERDNSSHIKISINRAMELTQKELLKLYQLNKGEENSQIFLAQKELLSSDIFKREIVDIEELHRVFDQEIEKLQGTKFQSRVSDYKDLKKRILSHLGIKTILSLPTNPYILLADDLLPSEVYQVSKTQIEGVILKKGSVSSHASILLRSLAIPSIIIKNNSIDENSKCRYSDIIIDANSGDIILKPTDRDIRKAKNKRNKIQAERNKSYLKRFQETKTLSGKKIKILANITDMVSAQEAKNEGADGIGLLRTEFLFTEKRPSLDEQIKVYKEIFKLFDDITIRTLDIGGDKSLPYINIPKEDNPFLGLRGIRFSLYEESLFREQLLAIFKAHNGKPIKIMFPMISEKREFRKAKKIAYEVALEHNIDISNILFGIMIEVPSVILALKVFDKGVDFFSIGTNDLTQYLFAIERTHPILKTDITSPIIMSALKIIIDNVSKPVSICGELAGVEEVTKELINLGYTTLSVSAKLIPSLKEKIRSI